MDKHLLHPVILGLDIVQHFRVGIGWNNQGQLYLHQDHKLLAYFKPSSSQDSVIFSVEHNVTRLIKETNILLLSQTIAVVIAKKYKQS